MERLNEIGRFYRDGRALRVVREFGAWFRPFLHQAWPLCGAHLARPYPTHGDFSLQNILLEPGPSLCLLDLEGFGLSSVNQDYATFRFRLEHLLLNPSFSRCRLARCWRAFHGRLAADTSEEAYLLVSYFHKLLAHVAWLANPQRAQADPRLTRMRNQLSARRRLRWLLRMLKCESVALACNRLTKEL